MLHVTNGTSVSLDASGLGGEVLAWVDVLHEGPVPAGLNLDELTRLRGIFLNAPLHDRDRRLYELCGADEVALWFEHDLYDQLQLLQVLDWFGGRERGGTRLTLICTDRYLGPLTGAQLAELWPSRHTVSAEELSLAAGAWAAFRSPDPLAIERLLAGDTSALPFLAGALRRHLQQFPSVSGGLSRTQRQILEAVRDGASDFGAIFRADQGREERIFMGDLTLADYIRGLCECRRPLLRETEERYALTPDGEEVIAGRADHVQWNGIHRWLGGAHLQGSDALWRWDEARGRLVAR